MVPVTRTNISPAAGAWTDVDVTAFVDPGNTAGVMLEVVNVSGGLLSWGVRKNGSGDTLYDDITLTSHTYVAIGVDASDIFECKIESTDIEVYIVGYIKNGEGSFFTNAVNKSLGVTLSWQDIDISGDTGGETAICAFFLMNMTVGLSRDYGLRKNGSGDNRKQDGTANDLRGAMMAVDGNEKLEGYIETTDVKFWLVGYLTDNCFSWANAKNYSTGNIGIWDPTDMSGDIPAGNDGAFFHAYQGAMATGIRKNGTGINNYYDMRNHFYGWVELDTNRKIEQKIENAVNDLFLWGYTNQPPVNQAPTAPTGQQVDGKSSPTGANCISSANPGFSAIYNDPDAGDTSNAIQIQVGTASGLSDMWDSGWLADTTVTPNRCTAKTYAGAALSAGTSYWWRCRFRDDDNAIGTWSAWQQFDMCAEGVPAGIGLQCVPGGVLPHRRPFACSALMPEMEPSFYFPYEYPMLPGLKGD